MQDHSSGRASLAPLGVRTWIVTNGAAGFEVQALGVAEALGVEPELKRVNPPPPWRWLAPWGFAAPDPAIAPPWPDLVIAAGRQAIPYARKIREAARGHTFVAVLQNPVVSPSQFDFVWAPEHDQLHGPNVLSTLTSPHRLSPERLAAEAAKLSAVTARLPHPRVAVLLGGSNAVYTLSRDTAASIAGMLSKLLDEGAGLMITPSRRTGETQQAIIRDRVAGRAAVMWDGRGDNPYFGYLGSADAVLVTCDSVNMVGEAAATGKPVYVIELEGGSPKFRRFLEGMYARGAARRFEGRLDNWQPVPLNATSEIADAIAYAFHARRA